MSNSGFRHLLSRWEKNSLSKQERQEVTVSLNKQDVLKISALARVYQKSEQDITAEIMHEALQELEEAMPYVAGQKVIRIEDGQEIYEDIGPTRTFIEVLNQLRDTEVS